MRMQKSWVNNIGLEGQFQFGVMPIGYLCLIQYSLVNKKQLTAEKRRKY